jgi:hypothetical protein
VESDPGIAVAPWGAAPEERAGADECTPGALGSELCEETLPELELLEWPLDDTVEVCCAGRVRQINRIVQTTRLENRIKHLQAIRGKLPKSGPPA